MIGEKKEVVNNRELQLGPHKDTNILGAILHQ